MRLCVSCKSYVKNTDTKCQYCGTIISEQTKILEEEKMNEKGKGKKLLRLEIVVDGDQLGKALSTQGFSDDISGTLEIIGLLEHAKLKEMEKLKTLGKHTYETEDEEL